MNAFSLILERFHAAIIENNAEIAEEDIRQSSHISVYIEGYRIRLFQAIRTDYPAFADITGEKEFERLALEFIESNPSLDFNLERYPNGFCKFILGKVDNKFATEVAILENAIAEVFIGEESSPLGQEIMSSLTAESLAALSMKTRPASLLLKLNYPVNNWLNAQRAGKKQPEPAPQKSYLYLYRHNNNVKRVELRKPEYILLEQLSYKKSLEDALEHTIDSNPQYKAEILKNLQVWFKKWLTEGFFCA